MLARRRRPWLGSIAALALLGSGCKEAPPDQPAAPVSLLAAAPSAVQRLPLPPAEYPPSVAPSTRTMAERLRAIAGGADPSRFDSSLRAAQIQSEFASIQGDAAALITARQQLADELLNAGQSDEALAVIEPLLHLTPDEQSAAPPGLEATTRRFIAFANLRIGEQANCIAHHGADSCLFPIQGGGVHTDQRGSRAAIEGFKAILAQDPRDLDSRWLLNVAEMTVGEYPDKVPPGYLIPPRTFDSEHEMKRFRDRAMPAGVAVRGHAGGAVMEDLDGDGLLDLAASGMGLRDQLRIFRNNGDGTFTDRTALAGVMGEWGGLYLAQADYDNDGDVDLLVMRGGWMSPAGRHPSSLLQNQGNGTFQDVTEAAGMLSLRPSQVAAWGDYDGDGWLDLFVGVESTGNHGDSLPSELWHNNHDGTFTNVAASVFPRPDLGWVKGATWGDYNNDGKPDLYVSVFQGHNLLLRNDGPKAGGKPGEWVFTNVAHEAGVEAPRESFATWFWDVDNDGWLDLYVSGYSYRPGSLREVAALTLGMPSTTEVPRLYRNNHDGTFRDVTKEKRLDRVALVMGSNFGDLDNDGRLDCYLGNGDPSLRTLIPNRMFRQGEDGVFQDVTTATGTGHLQKGHAVAFGDIDNDGDQDIYESMGGAYEGDLSQNALYENPGGKNHFITLRLQGKKANRMGVGGRIKVTVRGEGKDREIHTLVGAGGSFGGSSLQAEIGLGQAKSIGTLEVRWPGSGAVQTFKDVAMDAVYKVVEGEKALEKVDVKTFKLARGDAPE